MAVDERFIEAGELTVTLQREDTIARICDTLREPGSDDCIDCDAPIGAARKAALPSAERCIACQTKFEQRGPRGH